MTPGAVQLNADLVEAFAGTFISPRFEAWVKSSAALP